MLLSRSRPAPAPSAAGSGSVGDGDASSTEGKLPKLSDFLDKKDFLGALTLLEFQRSVNQQGVNHGSLIAYCSFHLGDYKRALEEYQALIQNPKKTIEESTIWLNIACCYFSMGMYPEAQIAASKGSECSLKTRILFHLCQKLDNEDGVIKYHQKLEETLENQLSLASMHYLRQDFQSSIDIYKRILLDNRCDIPELHFNVIGIEKADEEPECTLNAMVQSYGIDDALLCHALTKIHGDYIALNVYVALCYHRLEYFDVSQEVLAVYLQSFPGSAIALNLKACNTFRLYTGAAAERDLKPLLNIMHQDEQSKHGSLSNAYDLIRHNLVVFRAGQGALQILPKLVDVIPEARLNLIIYYLNQDDINNANTLIKDKAVDLKKIPESILYAVINVLLSYQTGNRDSLQVAQTFFNRIGSSESEHDSVFGRLCMASAHFLSKNFEHAALYLNSVRTHYYNDDTFNFNFAQAKGMLNQFQEVEELLTMIQNEKIRNDFTYVQWLARAYIMNKKPRLAWELYERMETSPESFRLLQLIGNECYRLGQFYYAAKAFDILERYEPNSENWEGKRGACIGVFQLIIAGQEPRESLHDIIVLLRNSSKPNVEKILGVMKKWAKDNRINL